MRQAIHLCDGNLIEISQQMKNRNIVQMTSFIFGKALIDACHLRFDGHSSNWVDISHSFEIRFLIRGARACAHAEKKNFSSMFNILKRQTKLNLHFFVINGFESDRTSS